MGKETADFQYGWQDPKHEWKWQANLIAHDGSHVFGMFFPLYRCIHCGAYASGEYKRSEDNYETPECKEA